ncbi:hypothetical protein D3C87_1560250 [compost metagenome]
MTCPVSITGIRKNRIALRIKLIPIADLLLKRRDLGVCAGVFRLAFRKLLFRLFPGQLFIMVQIIVLIFRSSVGRAFSAAHSRANPGAQTCADQRGKYLLVLIGQTAVLEHALD